MSSLFLFNCSGENDCDLESITQATNKIIVALEAYSVDPSTSNCDTYKAAIDDYISELDDCELVPQETIDNFQAERDALTCWSNLDKFKMAAQLLQPF